MDPATLMVFMLQVDMQVDSPYRERCQPLSEYEEICIKEYVADDYDRWAKSVITNHLTAKKSPE